MGDVRLGLMETRAELARVTRELEAIRQSLKRAQERATVLEQALNQHKMATRSTLGVVWRVPERDTNGA